MNDATTQQQNLHARRIQVQHSHFERWLTETEELDGRHRQLLLVPAALTSRTEPFVRSSHSLTHMGVFRAASVGRTEKEARVGRSAKRQPLWYSYFLRKEYGAHSDTRRNFHTVRLRVQWAGKSRWEVTRQIPVSYTRISACLARTETRETGV